MTVTITVQPVNDVPEASDAFYVTNEDQPLHVSAPGVMGNDFDADGDPLQTLVFIQPEHGSVVMQSDGSFVYTPDPNYFWDGQGQPDFFVYLLTDGNDPVDYNSQLGTVYILVRPVNDVPVAVDDNYTIAEDTVLSVNAPVGRLANDYDVDGDALTAVLVIPPTHGTLSQVNANGRFHLHARSELQRRGHVHLPGQRRTGRLQCGHRYNYGDAG